MSDEWVQKKAIREALDDPKPSDDQVGKALNALGEDGKAQIGAPEVRKSVGELETAPEFERVQMSCFEHVLVDRGVGPFRIGDLLPT